MERSSQRLVDVGFARLDTGMDGLDATMDNGFARVDALESGFARVERKLDQFIEAQFQTNERIEHRLSALTPPDTPNEA